MPDTDNQCVAYWVIVPVFFFYDMMLWVQKASAKTGGGLKITRWTNDGCISLKCWVCYEISGFGLLGSSDSWNCCDIIELSMRTQLNCTVIIPFIDSLKRHKDIVGHWLEQPYILFFSCHPAVGFNFFFLPCILWKISVVACLDLLNTRRILK